MVKQLSIVIKGLTILFLLALGVAGTLYFLVSPERFRPEIIAQFQRQTGLQLDIAGDLTLAVRPRVAFILRDIRMRNPEVPREMASAPEVTLNVNPLRLLQGELVVEALQIDDLHMNWHTDENGASNWRSASGDRGPDESSAALVSRIPVVTLRNASLDIQNLAAPYQATIRRLEVTARDVNVVNLPFPLEATFDWLDPASGEPLPVRFLSRNRVGLDRGDIDVGSIELAITPMLVRGDVQMRDISSNPSVTGKLASESFDVASLMRNLRLLPDADPTQPLSVPLTAPHRLMNLQVTFNSDARQLRVSDLQMGLGTMGASGEVTVSYGDSFRPTSVSYELQTTPLDFSPFFVPSVTRSPVPGLVDPVADDPAPSTEAPPGWQIPVRWMRDTTLRGSVAIGSLQVAEVQTGFINVFTNLEDGVLDLDTQPVQVLDGTVQVSVRVDTRPTDGAIDANLLLDRVDVSRLPLPMLTPGAVTGLVSAQARLQTRGYAPNNWPDLMTGSLAFRVGNSAVDIGLLKQVFTAISALAPSGEPIQQWPDVVRLADFNGYALLEQGIGNQQVQVRLDNFDIQGSGGINLAAGTFDYGLQFTVLGDPLLQTIPINNRYQNVPWPVQCAASFDAGLNQLCRPDFAQVRQIFSRPDPAPVLPYPQPRVAPEQLPATSLPLLRNIFPATGETLFDEDALNALPLPPPVP